MVTRISVCDASSPVIRLYPDCTPLESHRSVRVKNVHAINLFTRSRSSSSVAYLQILANVAVFKKTQKTKEKKVTCCDEVMVVFRDSSSTLLDISSLWSS